MSVERRDAKSMTKRFRNQLKGCCRACEAMGPTAACDVLERINLRGIPNQKVVLLLGDCRRLRVTQTWYI